MSIQKKSLISTLKTTKKANVASTPLASVEGGKSEKQFSKRKGMATYGHKKLYGQKYANASFAKKDLA